MKKVVKIKIDKFNKYRKKINPLRKNKKIFNKKTVLNIYKDLKRNNKKMLWNSKK